MSISLYQYVCPICNKMIDNAINEVKRINPTVGYIYQGKTRKYFHLNCLNSIKRGKSNG